MNSNGIDYTSLVYKIKNECDKNDYEHFMGKRWEYYYGLKSRKFNYIAAIFSIYWLIYRKFYKAAVLILTINTLLLLSINIFYNYSSISFPIIMIALKLLISLYLGIEGNYNYLLRFYNWKVNAQFKDRNYELNRVLVVVIFTVAFSVISSATLLLYDLYQNQYQPKFKTDKSYLLGGVKGYKSENGFTILLNSSLKKEGYIVKISNSGKEITRFPLPIIDNYYPEPRGVFSEDNKGSIYILYCTDKFYSDKILIINEHKSEIIEYENNITSLSQFHDIVGSRPAVYFNDSLYQGVINDSNYYNEYLYQLESTDSKSILINKMDPDNNVLFSRSYIRFKSKLPDLPRFVRGTDEIYLVGYLHQKRSFYISKFSQDGELIQVFE